MLYLSADDMLYYPSESMTVNSCRGVFRLHNGLTAGVPLVEGSASIRSFVLNFGDDVVTSIDHLPFTIDRSPLHIDHEAWYDLSGRKLNAKPTQKGLYIHNGRKVVIK